MTTYAALPGLPPPRGVVFNIMHFCVHDGPGIRTTVFLKGCPLHCAWCHNPESLSPRPELVVRLERCIRCGDCAEACPHGAIEETPEGFATRLERCAQCGSCADACAADARELLGKQMSVDDVMQEVKKDVVFYEESFGGVTFSGGEPLLQHTFLRAMLKACKEQGLHTAVDTTGYSSPAVLLAVSEFTDLFLYDVKAMDDATHRGFTGVTNGLVQGNLRRLASWGKRVIVRIPVIPGVNDSPGSIEATGRFVGALGNVLEVQLLPYHSLGDSKYARIGMAQPMPAIEIPSRERMIEVSDVLRKYHHAVSIGGYQS